MNLLLLVESISTSRKGAFLIVSSVLKFSSEFFFWSFFKFLNFVVGVCCDENVVYIADIYLGFIVALNILMWDMLNSDMIGPKGDAIEIPSICILHIYGPIISESDPGFERPACLATLKSSDRTKQSVYG